MGIDANDPALTGFMVTPSGHRVPVNRVKNIKNVIHSVIENSLLEPYNGEKVEFYGKTKIEAAIIGAIDSAAEGNSAELHTLLNRILGMPRQSNENINVTANLSDFLADLETNDPPTDEEKRAAGVMDAEFSIEEEE